MGVVRVLLLSNGLLQLGIVWGRKINDLFDEVFPYALCFIIKWSLLLYRMLIVLALVNNSVRATDNNVFRIMNCHEQVKLVSHTTQPEINKTSALDQRLGRNI